MTVKLHKLHRVHGLDRHIIAHNLLNAVSENIFAAKNCGTYS